MDFKYDVNSYSFKTLFESYGNKATDLKSKSTDWFLFRINTQTQWVILEYIRNYGINSGNYSVYMYPQEFATRSYYCQKSFFPRNKSWKNLNHQEVLTKLYQSGFSGQWVRSFENSKRDVILKNEKTFVAIFKYRRLKSSKESTLADAF